MRQVAVTRDTVCFPYCVGWWGGGGDMRCVGFLQGRFGVGRLAVRAGVFFGVVCAAVSVGVPQASAATFTMSGKIFRGVSDVRGSR